MLGIRWDLVTDQLRTLSLQYVSFNLPREPLLASWVDTLGILSPIVVNLKIFVQRLCEAKLDWDQLLTGKMLERWHHLAASLCEAKPFGIPRCYLNGVTEPVISYRLHGFCDASLKAYVAVVYLVVETISGRQVRILASKTSVSPIKTQTIPRLELLSALLLARLVHNVTQALESEMSLPTPHGYSDSTVTLFWIQGVEMMWKSFVQNRVLEIRRLIPPECWGHCTGRGNPADIPSRGHTPKQLAESQLWMTGPE